MDSIVQNVLGRLPDVYDKAKFNRNDLIAVMQGITGFAKAFAGKNPLDLIDNPSVLPPHSPINNA